MAGNGDAKHEIADDHIEDVTKNAADAAVQGTQPHLLAILPMLLGVFICGLNIFVAVWLWKTVYLSKYLYLSRFNLPTTIALSLLAISIFVGLFLIAYAIILRRSERNVQQNQLPTGSDQEPAHVPTYVRWILVPVVFALPAAALTLWAAQLVQPISPKSCLELYREAVNISKDAPNFKIYVWDRDQLRCNINSVIPNGALAEPGI